EAGFHLDLLAAEIKLIWNRDTRSKRPTREPRLPCHAYIAAVAQRNIEGRACEQRPVDKVLGQQTLVAGDVPKLAAEKYIFADGRRRGQIDVKFGQMCPAGLIGPLADERLVGEVDGREYLLRHDRLIGQEPQLNTVLGLARSIGVENRRIERCHLCREPNGPLVLVPSQELVL